MSMKYFIYAAIYTDLSIKECLTYKSEVTNHKLRGISSGLYLPQPRTNNMKISFMYDGAHLWNSIPNEIRECKSLSCFQNKIATHIFLLKPLIKTCKYISFFFLTSRLYYLDTLLHVNS